VHAREYVYTTAASSGRTSLLVPSSQVIQAALPPMSLPPTPSSNSQPLLPLVPKSSLPTSAPSMPNGIEFLGLLTWHIPFGLLDEMDAYAQLSSRKPLPTAEQWRDPM